METDVKTKKYSVLYVTGVLLLALGTLAVLDAKGFNKWAEDIKIGKTDNKEAAAPNQGQSTEVPSGDRGIGVFYALTNPWAQASESLGLGGLHKSMKTAFRDFAGAPPVSTWFFLPDLNALGKIAQAERDIALEKQLKTPAGEVIYSKEKPLRVLMIGDSMAGLYTAQVFFSTMKNQPAIEPHLLQKVSSTLSEPKYFDWPVEIVRAFAEKTYDVVFILLGSNDAQSIRTPKGYVNFGTPEWLTEYSDRTHKFLNSILSHVKRAYWVAVPPMTPTLPGYRDRMKSLNQILDGICASHENLRFIPVADILGDKNQNYSTTLPVDGKVQVVRMTDGIHLEYWGAVLLMRRMIDNLAVDFPSAVKK